jgi:hypothetical protein
VNDDQKKYEASGQHHGVARASQGFHVERRKSYRVIEKSLLA